MKKPILNLVFLLFSLSLLAQDRSKWFEFYLPSNDSSKTITDMSAYLDVPTDKNEFLKITPDEQNNGNTTSQKLVYEPKDKEIVFDIFKKFSSEKNTETGELIVKIGSYFIGATYVAHTLEIQPEQLTVNLREFDCTTFAENCLAIARTIKSEKPSFEQFLFELQNIRYRNGVINGYPSRIHYFSDWIYENSKRQVVKDITRDVANIIYPLQVNFMSTHPGSYIQLKNDSTLIPLISLQEKEISKREMYFIPEDKIEDAEKFLADGDIAGITTGIKGLDMVHVVILQRVNGRIHILHASTTANKVILSEETLEYYLKKNKSATGIMVARPL